MTQDEEDLQKMLQTYRDEAKMQALLLERENLLLKAKNDFGLYTERINMNDKIIIDL